MNAFPADIVEYNTTRRTPAEIQAWYAALPFELGVQVNSICWTAYRSHNDLVNAVKPLKCCLGDKIATIVAWYQRNGKAVLP